MLCRGSFYLKDCQGEIGEDLEPRKDMSLLHSTFYISALVFSVMLVPKNAALTQFSQISCQHFFPSVGESGKQMLNEIYWAFVSETLFT